MYLEMHDDNFIAELESELTRGATIQLFRERGYTLSHRRKALRSALDKAGSEVVGQKMTGKQIGVL